MTPCSSVRTLPLALRGGLAPTLLAALGLLGAPGAQSQTARPQPAPAAPAVANTPYAIGAQRNGVQKCIGRINQVTSFVTGTNPNSGLVLNAPNNESNQKLVSTVMEVQADANNSSFVSASFAPGAGNADCSATYDAVTYWNGTCAQVATGSFASFKVTQALNKTIFTLDGGPFVKVFLMPAGAGCISIKKEILF